VGELILDIEALIRRAQALHAAAVRVFDLRDEADADGAASTACWLRDRARLTDREARQVVGLARSLDRLPLMAAALAEGAVTVAHARTLAGQTKRLDPATVADGEEFLVGCARRFDAYRFGAIVRRWVATVAPAVFERDAERRYDARWLTVAETFGGMVSVSGMLEPEGGAVVASALDALLKAVPSDDGRSREQQRADALVDLVELARCHELLPVTGGNRPEILVHASVAAVTSGAPTAPPVLTTGSRSPGRRWTGSAATRSSGGCCSTGRACRSTSAGRRGRCRRRCASTSPCGTAAAATPAARAAPRTARRTTPCSGGTAAPRRRTTWCCSAATTTTSCTTGTTSSSSSRTPR
jgi:hypothetical protein